MYYRIGGNATEKVLTAPQKPVIVTTIHPHPNPPPRGGGQGGGVIHHFNKVNHSMLFFVSIEDQ
jgi:hypothetical protein